MASLARCTWAYGRHKSLGTRGGTWGTLQRRLARPILEPGEWALTGRVPAPPHCLGARIRAPQSFSSAAGLAHRGSGGARGSPCPRELGAGTRLSCPEAVSLRLRQPRLPNPGAWWMGPGVAFSLAAYRLCPSGTPHPLSCPPSTCTASHLPTKKTRTKPASVREDPLLTMLTRKRKKG